MKKKIAIIGSGVAGLVLGNLLKRSQSCDFMIYEKEDGLRFNEGYGIQLSTNSISILNEIDFDNIDEKQVFNPNKINFFSESDCATVSAVTKNKPKTKLIFIINKTFLHQK